MSSDTIKILAGLALIGGAGFYLQKKKGSGKLPVSVFPNPVEVDDSPEGVNTRVSPGYDGGISLGWAPAPVPVRPAFDAPAWEDRTPTPGHFYQTRKGDTAENIASRAVRVTALQAAELAGVPELEREQWVREVSRSHEVVGQAVESLSTGWNDELYGRPAQPGERAPHGRALDLTASHDAIRDALEAGRTPRRNLTTGGGVIRRGSRNRPYIWIPAWDPEQLLKGCLDHSRDPIRSKIDPYGSGVSGHWPPTNVTERGIL